MRYPELLRLPVREQHDVKICRHLERSPCAPPLGGAAQTSALPAPMRPFPWARRNLPWPPFPCPSPCSAKRTGSFLQPCCRWMRGTTCSLVRSRGGSDACSGDAAGSSLCCAARYACRGRAVHRRGRAERAVDHGLCRAARGGAWPIARSCRCRTLKRFCASARPARRPDQAELSAVGRQGAGQEPTVTAVSHPSIRGTTPKSRSSACSRVPSFASGSAG